MEYTPKFLELYREYVIKQDNPVYENDYQDPLTVDERMILTQLHSADCLQRIAKYLKFFYVLTIISLISAALVALFLFF